MNALVVWGDVLARGDRSFFCSNGDRARPARKGTTYWRYPGWRRDWWTELSRLVDATAWYRLSKPFQHSQVLSLPRHSWDRWPGRDHTWILLRYSVEENRSWLQSPSASERCVGPGQPRARCCGWLLPSSLDGAQSNQLGEIGAHHSAGCGEQLPVRPTLRHDRGILNKDAPRVQGVLRLHRDEGGKPPESPLLPESSAQVSGHGHRSKGNHE